MEIFPVLLLLCRKQMKKRETGEAFVQKAQRQAGRR